MRKCSIIVSLLSILFSIPVYAGSINIEDSTGKVIGQINGPIKMIANDGGVICQTTITKYLVCITVSNAISTATPTSTPTSTPTITSTPTSTTTITPTSTPAITILSTPSALPTYSITTEYRPQNIPYNNPADETDVATFQTTIQTDPNVSALVYSKYYSKVDGDLVTAGQTTQTILEMALIKWFGDQGFATIDPSWLNFALADGQIETGWIQFPSHGDTYLVTPTCPLCGSWGLYQVGGAPTSHGWPETYPLSSISTQFNADFWGAYLRAVYDGQISYMAQDPPPVGQSGQVCGIPYLPATPSYLRFQSIFSVWYSGHWCNTAGVNYMNQVIAAKNAEAWMQSNWANMTVKRRFINHDRTTANK